MENYITKEELDIRLNMSFEDKVDLSCERIEKWYDYWKGQVYVAFSGGKDSTVLLNLVRSIFPEIKGVFIDTGLEYPEIRDFVMETDNIIWIKPKMSFKEVIERYGYPVISKEQSDYIYDYRNTKSEKLKNLRLNGNDKGNFKIQKKWIFLTEAPFKISDKCCDKLKKNPAHQYNKESGEKPMLGTRVEESRLRRTNYLKYGCNIYNSNNPQSAPLSFWRDEDIDKYIEKYNISYSKIYDMGYERTGCMFCMFGVQNEKEPNRFQKMEITHPKIHNYCINNLGLGDVMDYIGISYKNKEKK